MLDSPQTPTQQPSPVNELPNIADNNAEKQNQGASEQCELSPARQRAKPIIRNVVEVNESAGKDCAEQYSVGNPSEGFHMSSTMY